MRNMSFALTTEQVRRQTKTVTGARDCCPCGASAVGEGVSDGQATVVAR